MKPNPLNQPLALVISLALLGLISAPLPAAIPVAGDPQPPYRVYLPLVARDATSAGPALSTYDQFVAAVSDGQAGVVRGVYVPDFLALRVQQQPPDNPTYISPQAGTATQFQTAAAFGVTGLLAHNSLAGAQFFSLAAGQEVRVIYGDGTAKGYRITTISRFQALDPNNPYSLFVDLATGASLTSNDLFTEFYTGGDAVTFQTCIASNGSGSWGRLFVVAAPES